MVRARRHRRADANESERGRHMALTSSAEPTGRVTSAPRRESSRERWILLGRRSSVGNVVRRGRLRLERFRAPGVVVRAASGRADGSTGRAAASGGGHRGMRGQGRGRGVYDAVARAGRHHWLLRRGSARRACRMSPSGGAARATAGPWSIGASTAVVHCLTPGPRASVLSGAARVRPRCRGAARRLRRGPPLGVSAEILRSESLQACSRTRGFT
jgi:hypothetical protein